MQLVIAILKKK